MTTRPFPMTPQIEAHVASEVAKAISCERIQHEADLRRVKAELGTAQRRLTDHQRDDEDRELLLAEISEIACAPMPCRFGMGREALRRLHLIRHLLDKDDS